MNRKYSRNFILKAIALIVALIFTSTTLSWSAALRPTAFSEIREARAKGSNIVRGQQAIEILRNKGAQVLNGAIAELDDEFVQKGTIGEGVVIGSGRITLNGAIEIGNNVKLQNGTIILRGPLVIKADLTLDGTDVLRIEAETTKQIEVNTLTQEQQQNAIQTYNSIVDLGIFRPHKQFLLRILRDMADTYSGNPSFKYTVSWLALKNGQEMEKLDREANTNVREPSNRRFVVIFGPPAVGKNTVTNYARQRLFHCDWTPRVTTRAPRVTEGETQDNPFIFISKQQYDQLKSGQPITADTTNPNGLTDPYYINMINENIQNGNKLSELTEKQAERTFYATLKSLVDKRLQEGWSFVNHSQSENLTNRLQSFKDAIFLVYLTAPENTVIERLQNRAAAMKAPQAATNERIETAKESFEVARAHEKDFHYVIDNSGEPAVASEKFLAVLVRERFLYLDPESQERFKKYFEEYFLNVQDDWNEVFSYIPGKDEDYLADWDKRITDASVAGAVDVTVCFDLGERGKKTITIKVPKDKEQQVTLHVGRYVASDIFSATWGFGPQRILIACDDADLTQQVLGYFNPGGAYKDQRKFIRQAYQKDLEIRSASLDEINQLLGQQPVGKTRNPKRGSRIGVDLGSSDVKVCAVKEGKVLYYTKGKWSPKKFTNLQQHYQVVKELIETALAKAKEEDSTFELDGIGISTAGVVIDNEIRLGAMYERASGGSRDKFQPVPLAGKMQEEFKVPVDMFHDSDAGALFAAVDMKLTNVLALAEGSSLGAGFVDKDGNIAGYLGELGKAIIDMHPKARPHDEYPTVTGPAKFYLSQQGAFRLASQLNITVPQEAADAARLEAIYNSPDKEKVRKLWELLALYNAAAIAKFYRYYGMTEVVLFGRVFQGDAQDKIVSAINEILTTRYPDVAANVTVRKPEAKIDGVEPEDVVEFGQAIAATYYSSMNNEERLEKLVNLRRLKSETGSWMGCQRQIYETMTKLKPQDKMDVTMTFVRRSELNIEPKTVTFSVPTPESFTENEAKNEVYDFIASEMNNQAISWGAETIEVSFTNTQNSQAVFGNVLEVSKKTHMYNSITKTANYTDPVTITYGSVLPPVVEKLPVLSAKSIPESTFDGDVVTIDFGGTAIKFGLLKKTGEFIPFGLDEQTAFVSNGTKPVATRGGKTPEEIIQDIADYTNKILAYSRKQKGNPLVCQFITPGLILENKVPKTSVLEDAGKWNDDQKKYWADLATHLSDAIELPVYVNNDGQGHAIANLPAIEKIGEDGILLTIGTAIACSLINKDMSEEVPLSENARMRLNLSSSGPEHTSTHVEWAFQQIASLQGYRRHLLKVYVDEQANKGLLFNNYSNIKYGLRSIGDLWETKENRGLVRVGDIIKKGLGEDVPDLLIREMLDRVAREIAWGIEELHHIYNRKIFVFGGSGVADKTGEILKEDIEKWLKEEHPHLKDVKVVLSRVKDIPDGFVGSYGAGLLGRRNYLSRRPSVIDLNNPATFPTHDEIQAWRRKNPAQIVGIGGGHGIAIAFEIARVLAKKTGEPIRAEVIPDFADNGGNSQELRLALKGIATPGGFIQPLLQLLGQETQGFMATKLNADGSLQLFAKGTVTQAITHYLKQAETGLREELGEKRFEIFKKHMLEFGKVCDAELVNQDARINNLGLIKKSSIKNLLEIISKMAAGAYPRGAQQIDQERFLVGTWLLSNILGLGEDGFLLLPPTLKYPLLNIGVTYKDGKSVDELGSKKGQVAITTTNADEHGGVSDYYLTDDNYERISYEKLPRAYEPSVEAITRANVVIIGPGTTYSSVLQSLLIPGIAQALVDFRKKGGLVIFLDAVEQQRETKDTTRQNLAEMILKICRGSTGNQQLELKDVLSHWLSLDYNKASQEVKDKIQEMAKKATDKNQGPVIVNPSDHNYFKQEKVKFLCKGEYARVQSTHTKASTLAPPEFVELVRYIPEKIAEEVGRISGLLTQGPAVGVTTSNAQGVKLQQVHQAEEVLMGAI